MKLKKLVKRISDAIDSSKKKKKRKKRIEALAQLVEKLEAKKKKLEHRVTTAETEEQRLRAESSLTLAKVHIEKGVAALETLKGGG